MEINKGDQSLDKWGETIFPLNEFTKFYFFTNIRLFSNCLVSYMRTNREILSKSKS